MSLIKELYAYRELLKSNIKKEIRGKYKGSFLGVLWSFINPLLSVLVYAIVFPYLMRGTVDNYLVYLITGVIPWTFFTTVMSQGMASIKVNAGIINFFISCVIILVFCAIFAVGFSWHLLLLPIAALLQFLICLGLTLAFSAINIYIKDMEYIINFVINMLFYGTPILYELSGFSTQVPAFLLWLVKINPFTHLMQIYRDIFMYHQLTDIWSWAYVALIALVCLVLGLFIFKKLEKGFAEEV